jgi:hypothetical protein
MLSTLQIVYVCVCVCVWERERERERGRICKTLSARLLSIKCQKTNIFHIHRCGIPQIPHTKNVAHIAHCIPYLRRLLAYLSPRTSGFYPRPVHVRFVVDKLTSGQVLLPALLFSFASVIPPVLHSRSFVSHQLFIILTNDRIVKQTLKIETTYLW